MRLRVAALAALAGLAACSDAGTAPLAPTDPNFSRAFSGVVWVTNARGAGPGSFAQAIVVANGNSSIHRVAFASRLGTITLQQPVVYAGGQALAIDGNGATLDGRALGAGAGAFAATGGGDLDLRGLTVRGAPGVGITVVVPGDASGTIKVSLLNVAATDNGSHGVLINDQAEYFNDPNSTSPAGSDASLDVVVIASRFERNGFTALDQDGLRINEGGVGSLRAVISASRVLANGGDGVELDERAEGDAVFSVVGSVLDRNGGFAAVDFDDGMDVDESGDGSIIGGYFLTSVQDNFEQGIDLNENDAGDLRVDMAFVQAVGNQEEGIEYEEDDDFAGGGDIVANLVAVKTRRNGAADGDAGLKLREKGPGNLTARLSGVESSDNFVDGVLLREDADGSLAAEIRNATATGNVGDGIEFDENSTGDLAATVEKATSSNNTQAGVRADQAAPGTGTLQLVAVMLSANGAGAIIANAGVTVTQVP